MPIVISDHAKRQLKRRKISQKISFESGKKFSGDSKEFSRQEVAKDAVGSKMLEIITRTEGSKITVITANYLKK